MCFRPADASAAGPSACPSCGKTLQSMGGITLSKCPFCKADLTTAAPEASSAPKAPGAPAPQAPGVPKAPGAPKAPGTPAPRA